MAKIKDRSVFAGPHEAANNKNTNPGKEPQASIIGEAVAAGEPGVTVC